MNESAYPFEEGPLEYTYRFESVSEQATIQKAVIFTKIEQSGVFNLALVDDLPDGLLSDTVVSNNDDMVTVLTTVFQITADFLNRFPDVSVYFSGSDARRIRLYRVAISRELENLQRMYTIVGLRSNSISPFSVNLDYDGFLIAKKL